MWTDRQMRYAVSIGYTALCSASRGKNVYCDSEREQFRLRGAMSQAIVTAFVLCLLYECCHLVAANPDAKRLYDDLLRKRKYNKLMRPVQDHNNKLNVTINLKLSQLIDVVSALQLLL